MSDTPAALAEKLRLEGEKAAAFFGGLTITQWAQPVYTEGQTWRARDVLAHFLSAERSFFLLFQSIVTGGPGASPDFSIDRFNLEQVARLVDTAPEDLLAQYRAARTEMAVWVASLAPEDLEKHGRHPALGKSSLGDMIKMVYLHNQMHLRDLRKAVVTP